MTTGAVLATSRRAAVLSGLEADAGAGLYEGVWWLRRQSAMR